jgi:hypothetical protein
VKAGIASAGRHRINHHLNLNEIYYLHLETIKAEAKLK